MIEVIPENQKKQLYSSYLRFDTRFWCLLKKTTTNQKKKQKKTNKYNKNYKCLHASLCCRGEGAFSVLSDYEYIWPADAMKPHLTTLTPSVPITFIYGEKSPFNNHGGEDIGRQRENVFVPDPLPDIGHHVQIQNAHLFNNKMREIMSSVDRNSDRCRQRK